MRETADVKCYRGVEDGISKEDERMVCADIALQNIFMTDLFTELFFAQFVQCKELLSQNDILYKTATGKFHSHDDLERTVVYKL